MSRKVLVTGAGGFIGHRMVRFLKDKGCWVRGVDIKRPEWQTSDADEFMIADLRQVESCKKATQEISDVYHFAADMGGIGYITAYHADVAANNVLINTHLLSTAVESGVSRLFFSSSACVYPAGRQITTEVTGLREEDAIPAEPEEGYGWEKLFTERMCEYYRQDHGLETRVARFHNVYGPFGSFEGGREKAPAAICRKVALAPRDGEIEVWGDGQQTRSFMYIDDCVEGVFRLMESGWHDPINIGSDERVTVDELVDIVCDVAGKPLKKRHDFSKPQGVRGRNSDNARVSQVLSWKPSTSLRTGIRITYKWIEETLGGRVFGT